MEENRSEKEIAFLVGIQHQEDDFKTINEHLDELKGLVETLSLQVGGRAVAKVRTPSARLLTGSGKAQEILNAAKECGAEIIVFDDSLSPSQQRNWEKLSGNLAIIDRQEVILDIFAARAQTREAVLQVQLAKAEYDLPRLKRRWTHLSRQRGMAGGMGLRGEGETQIEVDARLVKTRITTLQSQLKNVRRQRSVQRKQRQRKPVPVAAIVGYTNVGKSSLLNVLTDSSVLVADKLFATLDPTVRRIQLTNHQELLLSDTVGLIRKLPHMLVDAFKATLDEVAEADLLLEVLDASSPQLEDQHQTTMEVIRELGAEKCPRIVVLNKIDLLPEPYMLRRLLNRFPVAVGVSARTGTGLAELRRELAVELNRNLREVELLLPHDRYDLIALLHRTAQISREEHLDNGVLIKATVPVRTFDRVETFLHNSA